MAYTYMSLLSILIFVGVHLWADKTKKFDFISQGRFLSAGGGVAIAYVFVDLLPTLCTNDQIVREALAGIFPYFERHVFVMALIGFLLFFVVDRTHKTVKGTRAFWLSFISYALFNFMVGYAVVDPNNLEVQPLTLFTFAMGLHYFVNDYTINQTHGQEFRSEGKWLLILCLFFGWLSGLLIVIPQAAIALASAFIGGGVIMNVIRHELPAENPHSLGAFLISAALYTAILLSIG